MIAYASHTGTKRNLAQLRRYGWRLLVAPIHRTAPLHGFAYALDNGAWHAHQAGEKWDRAAFVDLLSRRAAGADWIVVPDVVGNGKESLRTSIEWLPAMSELRRPMLIAVQEGLTPADLDHWIGPSVGIFVGGASAGWKESTMAGWAALARSKGAYCHVGRVNSGRRIRLCALAGVDSFDGTSASKYAVTTAPLDRARRQRSWIM